MQCGTTLSERKPMPAPELAKEEVPAPAVETPPGPEAPPAPAPAPEHPCPAHAEMPVAGTCPRCGKFVCARCASRALDGDLMCSDCIARGLVMATVWIAYFLRSERVKRTFVK
jgi:hypothetical protein